MSVDFSAKLLRLVQLRNFQSSSSTITGIITTTGGSPWSRPGRARSDHWVVGASKHFFTETSAAVKETRALVVLLQIPTTVLILTRLVAIVRFIVALNDPLRAGDVWYPPLCKDGLTT
eukprot:scaffold410392_cov30-Prasinocladus_malaysianus.AAC.1